MIEKAAENSAYRNAEIEEGTFEAESEEASFSKNGSTDIINWHSQSTGPFEAKISPSAAKSLKTIATTVPPSEYKTHNSTVLENNDGVLHPNTIGCEATFENLYIYFVDSSKKLWVIDRSTYGGLNKSRGNLSRTVA
jgi:hypothetical protein